MPTNWNASSRNLQPFICFPMFTCLLQLCLFFRAVKLRTLRKRRYHLDALFLIQVYLGSEFRHSRLETVGVRAPARYIRKISLFFVRFSSINCPPTRCASGTNVVCRDVDVFGTKTVSLNHILYWYFLNYKNINCIQYEYMYTFCSHRLIVGMVAIIAFLLLSK
jgi:hypothetical protein